MRSLHLALLAGVLFSTSCSSNDPAEIDMEIEVPAEFTLTTANWMQGLQLEYPDQEIRLRDLSLPGSHDAGMYILQNCSIGANACNVQTQHQDMRAQLLDGIRSFDIRPIYKNNFFFTRHSQGCDGLGCYGVRVDVMLQQLKEFLDSQAELVLLYFGHWCYTDGNDAAFRELVSSVLGDRLFKEASDPGTLFIDRSLGDIIPPEGQTGKAIAIMNGISNTAENRAQGFFASGYIGSVGSYANAQVFEDMKTDQFNKFQNFSETGNNLFELSWTLTQNAELAVACALPGNPTSIRDLANTANPHLSGSMDEWIAAGEIRPGRIPNMIGVDFCESFVTDVCIRLSRINLE